MSKSNLYLRDMGLLLLIHLSANLSSACFCVAPPLPAAIEQASVVFEGKVRSQTFHPTHPKSSIPRSAVTFDVKKTWKGEPGASITLHVREPRPDCIGARFTTGESYVVFARIIHAADAYLEEYLWYGWLDLFPKGTLILTVNNACDFTGPSRKSRKTIRHLNRLKSRSVR
jgi:hypothetical protein